MFVRPDQSDGRNRLQMPTTGAIQRYSKKYICVHVPLLIQFLHVDSVRLNSPVLLVSDNASRATDLRDVVVVVRLDAADD